VAVAVNGVIRAITHLIAPSKRSEPSRWSALVEAASFLPGRNEVEIYTAESSGLNRPQLLGPVTLRFTE
jgi:hypothetical protein